MTTNMIKGKDYIGVGIGAVIINQEKKLFLAKRGKKALAKKVNGISQMEEFGFTVEPVDTL